MIEGYVKCRQSLSDSGWEYPLNRKNMSTGYSVFTDWMLAVPSFEIAVQMKLEKSSDKESSAGIIFYGTGRWQRSIRL